MSNGGSKDRGKDLRPVVRLTTGDTLRDVPASDQKENACIPSRQLAILHREQIRRWSFSGVRELLDNLKPLIAFQQSSSEMVFDSGIRHRRKDLFHCLIELNVS